MSAVFADMGGPSSGGPEMTVAVALPAYNEGGHVADVVSGLPAWVDAVFVTDDGSTDDTVARLEALEDPRLTLLSHEANRGFGASLRTAYLAALDAGIDVVVKMDADGQMSPDDLASVVAPITCGLADFVKGNRFHGREQLEAMPADRRIGNLVASFIAKPATGYWHVFDPHCGYTAAAATALRRFELDDMADDYHFQIQQLMMCRALGARVVDVPVETIYADEVSGMHFGHAIAFPYEMCSGWAWRRSRTGGLKHRCDAARERAACYEQRGWWRSPANLLVGVGALVLSIGMLTAGLVLGAADRLGVRRRSPGSAETRVAHDTLCRESLTSRG